MAKASVYNWQWGREVAVRGKLAETMTAENFLPQHTGGGCMAWERPTEDGGHIWITNDAGLGAWKDRARREWVVGRYGGDGDSWIDCFRSFTLAEALRIADIIPQPSEEGQEWVPPSE